MSEIRKVAEWCFVRLFPLLRSKIKIRNIRVMMDRLVDVAAKEISHNSVSVSQDQSHILRQVTGVHYQHLVFSRQGTKNTILSLTPIILTQPVELKMVTRSICRQWPRLLGLLDSFFFWLFGFVLSGVRIEDRPLEIHSRYSFPLDLVDICFLFLCLRFGILKIFKIN